MEKIDQAALLGHLPPHVRDKMLKRVEVLKRYVRDKSRTNAEQGAAELGLSMVHFKKLAHVWELYGRADRLPGAEWPKTKSTSASDELMGALRQAIDESPSSTVSNIARRAIEIATLRGIAIPSRNTLRARIADILADAAPVRSSSQECDIVVVHAALNLPVQTDGGATMPIAALAVHPPTRTVLGIGLSDTCITARAAAQALKTALRRLPLSSAVAASTGPMRIGLDTLPGPEWSSLRSALEQVGVVIEGDERALPRRDAAANYLGRKVSGIQIRPRLATKPAAERTPYVASGQKHLTLKEAEAFAAKRMIPEIQPSASAVAADHIMERLDRWLTEAKS
ncbi:hypothetical protein [Sphingomonas sp.]|jgi:hypothetical protein|uniref:hypothetical protein n=1 Tax=Sphingomonas sp. TaxID=28214 RepID=UPI0026036792|nr:hypothetical protein [Sphingomonas sp.]MDF2605131.1 hypothetical protein [Sphingomonas sp.]